MKKVLFLISLLPSVVNAAPTVGYIAATNISSAVTSNIVTRQYVEDLGISGAGVSEARAGQIATNSVAPWALVGNPPPTSGLDTNAVDALIYSYDTTNITARLDAKADALTEAQTNAVNSGITAAKVGTYDGYAAMISGKQDKPSSGGFVVTNEYGYYSSPIKIGDYANFASTLLEGENGTGKLELGLDTGVRLLKMQGAWNDTFVDIGERDTTWDWASGKLYVNGPSAQLFVNGTNVMSAIGSNASTIGSLAETQAVNTAAIDGWETYWTGDRVRLSVTNYYGNTSGDLARLRVEESETNSVGTITGWRTVWDENDRATNTLALVYAATNGIVSAAKQYTDSQVISRAPRAWGSLTSAGTRAPNNMVWMTEPNTVFAGGTEYAHVSVGEGSICVLVDNGAPVYTEGETGQFRFKDDSGQYYFGFDVRSAYTIGCRTDDISVTKVSGTNMVTLVYDLVSATNPEILHCTNLLEDAWTTAEASWEQNPPTGTKVCYLNAGTNSCGFYKAQLSYAGGSKFVTNMQADLTAGIAASNETLNVIQSVEPYISNGQVLWRVKQ